METELKFQHFKPSTVKGQHTITNWEIMLRIHEADFATDEEMTEAIAFILSKLNS